jgi:Icc protein
MVLVIAQISDVHIGGPKPGGGDRFSLAIDAINEMARQPDLVLVTGDLTQSGETAEWDEFNSRVESLRAPWNAIRGNHDRSIDAFIGHRSLDLGDLHLILVDTSADVFTDEDAAWVDADLATCDGQPTVIAVHHPPFETGIWWMDCVGLRGAERFEQVVRRHTHVRHVMSGHVHRPITTAWANCLVTVCPSTSVAIAADLDPGHDPAETDEPPMIALHAYLPDTVVSHVVAVGPAARRSSIGETAPDFVSWARQQQAQRHSAFASP